MDNYFIWSGKPELFTIPKIPLPFSVSIVGLLFAYFVWTYVIGQQEEKGKNSKRKSAEKTKKTNKWILLGGFLVVSQIVGIPLNLFVFDSLGPISIRWYGLLFAGSFVSTSTGFNFLNRNNFYFVISIENNSPLSNT